MAIPRKLKVGVAYFPYAGTSSGSSQVYDLTPWTVRVSNICERDERISELLLKSWADTPAPMVRNAAVLWARRNGVDVLIMVDSDMSPDCELGRDPAAKPFFETSFNFIYDRWEQGPHVVCAPYCGPPPAAMPYVFKWSFGYDRIEDTPMSLQMYSREEAAAFEGIHACAAQPTGLIMFDMRAFDLTDPVKHGDEEKESRGWFYYEWTDKYAATKASTEDVTATRDLSLAGHAQLGRDVIFCNWDAWAGHNKVYCVGKPRPAYADAVSKRYASAVLAGRVSNEKLVMLDLDHGQV